MKVIDANGLILGRLATRIAKLALMGETVNVVNCEKSVISGDKYNLYDKYIDLRHKGGPFHGPFFPRMPDRIVRRVVRSMLPYKNDRGSEAYARVKCFIGVPETLKNEEMISFSEVSKEKISRAKIISIGEISKRLGAKYNE